MTQPISHDPYDDVRDTYATQRIGGGTVGFGEQMAVLVVDFQHLYTRGRASTGLDAVHRTATLLEAARRAQVRIVYTYVGYDPADLDGGVWTMKCPGLLECVRGSEACQIDELIAPQPDDLVIEKRAASAFFNTGLAETLHGAGIDTIAVCGTSTSGCVRASVVDGVSWDFRMLVVEECVTDRSEPSHRAALFDINTKYGDVVSLEEVLSYLSQRPVAG